MIGRLLSAKVWKSVKDGYIPSKRVKSAAQKEAKMNNALALAIIRKSLSKDMRDKMKTITSAKELLLSLEQIYKEDDEEDEEKVLEMLMEVDAENKMRQSQQFDSEEPSDTDSEESSNIEMSDSEEPSNTGKYTGNISKPPVDFIENDCSKLEKCFYSHYNPENENEESKVERCFHSHCNL